MRALLRLILATVWLHAAASSALAQFYSDVDLMADQVHVAENNWEAAPRVTIGFQNEEIGARVRYWHLNTTVDLDPAPADYKDDRYHFDVLDFDIYKQLNWFRLFGGMRVGYLTFSETSSPATNASLAYRGIWWGYDPIYLNAEDRSESHYYPGYYGPTYTDTSNSYDYIRSMVFGPTAGLEGDVPLIGNLWFDYGARCSVLLANWYSSEYSFSSSSGPWGAGYSLSKYTNRFTDTLIVPEIYTGLELRWKYAELGAKFEVQRWRSEEENYTLQSPTIFGVGATLGVRF
jgi:hypothetical protein